MKCLSRGVSHSGLLIVKLNDWLEREESEFVRERERDRETETDRETERDRQREKLVSIH